MSLQLVTAPEDDVLGLEEAKAHLRVLSDDEDDYITGLLAAATSYLDGEDGVLGRALATQEWDMFLESFPECGKPIEIPLPPLQDIEHVKYLDADGELQTLDAGDYEVEIGRHCGFIHLAEGASWPSALCRWNGVQVRFTCGYEDMADAPATVKQLMKLLVSHWFENREPVNVGNIVTPMPLAVDTLVATLSVKKF